VRCLPIVGSVSTSDVIPTLRSLPTAEGIAELVQDRYRLDVDECVLIRSFVNEVHEVAARLNEVVRYVGRYGARTDNRHVGSGQDNRAR